MNRKIYLLPLSLLLLVFTSCDESSEPGKYDNWKARNEAFIDSLQNVYDAKTDPELKVLKDSRNQASNIFYKVIKEGDITQQPPYLNSTTEQYYRGMFIDEAVFAASPNEKYYTRLWRNLTVFDSSIAEDDPNPDFDASVFLPVNGTINGWTEVMQWMHPGDRWEVYIPSQSAYGPNDYTPQGGGTTIPGGSTLIFDITLVSITY